MKQYDSYKDSGVQWIGEIPNHWKMRKMKYDFQIYAGATPKTENANYWDGNVVWITPADYKTNDKYVSEGQRTITEEGYNSCNTQLVPKGSLIFSKRAPIGTVAISSVDLCTNQGCLSCAPKDANTLYFYYLTSVFTEIFDLFGSGATFREISADAFANIKLPLPPLSEQQAIATYLDKKCAEIDKAIATQQRRIELLQELRQNIITHAVTRGINPDAPLKDSGVEWIGMVPEHWEVMMLKRCATIKTGCTPPTKEEKYYEADDIDWFTPGDIGDDHIEEAEKKISDSAKRDGVCRIFPAKSVYFVGIGATIGKVSYCNIEASANQQINAIIPNKRANYKYITYCLKSQKEEVFLTANTVTLPIINQDRTGSLRIPVPPLKEQQAIVAYVEAEATKLDKLVAKANRQITLLQELKQSIITEVVTGKRKVC